MKRFRNILYYTDGRADSGPALERAAELAMRNRGRLTVVGVLHELPRDVQMLVPTTPPADLLDLALQDLRERLEQLAKPARQEGLRLTVKVLCGTPFLEIIRAVLRDGHDLVMMNAEGGTGRLKELFLGSISLHLLRKCPCPVWVIKPGPHRRFERILAAVDPDPFHEEKTGLATKIMELASSLAELEGSQLRVVHGWGVFAEDTLRHAHRRLPLAEVERIVRETEATHERWLNELLSRHDLSGIPHNVHLLKGDPAEVIVKLADRRRVDLIVMGTVGRTGIEGFLIGNTAETVLRQVHCSVLAVKPHGFVSPVQPEEQPGPKARTRATERNPA